jgi:phosphatidylinositol 4-kinase A
VRINSNSRACPLDFSFPIEWALPDQLVYSTVSALLRTAAVHPQHRTAALNAIFDFTRTIVQRLEQGTCMVLILNAEACCLHRLASDVLSQFAPSFHGFYRAIISVSFPWKFAEWTALSLHLNPLFSTSTIERLNRLLVDVLQHHADDAARVRGIQTLLSRYVARGRPLTGYFIVCCVIEAQWTVLAQVINVPEVKLGGAWGPAQEAEAADQAWLAILSSPISVENIPSDGAARVALKKALRQAMECFSELLLQIEEMDTEPELDTYAWETMSESLVRLPCARP